MKYTFLKSNSINFNLFFKYLLYLYIYMTTIDEYTLVKKLGEGAFGITYLAKNKKDEKFVIKKINKKKNEPQEISILKKIEQYGCQPDILCYVKDFTKGDYIYIVTKMFPNAIELGNYIHYEKKNITPMTRLLLCLNITSALYKLHNLNIAHMDIKGDNILVNSITTNIQLIDFGSSCNKDKIKKCLLGGTIDYDSPELISALINKKTQFDSFEDYLKKDIFSLGVMFYKIFYKDSPMDEYNDTRLLADVELYEMKILLNYYKTSKIGLKLKPDESPIDNLISKMLSFNPNDRPNIQTIQNELVNIIKEYLNPDVNKTKMPISTLQQLPATTKRESKKPSTKRESKKLSTRESKEKTKQKKIPKKVPGSKTCPEDKELNPKTNRCVKKCKDGYIRNPETFKCIKQKK